VQSTQRELRRLGFYRGPVDGVWARSQRRWHASSRARLQQRRVQSGDLSALGFDPNNLARARAAALFGERAALI